MKSIIDVSMVLERETKGAVRYQEVDAAGNPMTEDYKIGTLYIRKSALKAEPQKNIKVVISA